MRLWEYVYFFISSATLCRALVGCQWAICEYFGVVWRRVGSKRSPLECCSFVGHVIRQAKKQTARLLGEIAGVEWKDVNRYVCSERRQAIVIASIARFIRTQDAASQVHHS